MGLHQIGGREGAGGAHEKRVTAALFLRRTQLCHYSFMKIRSALAAFALTIGLCAALPLVSASAAVCPPPPTPPPVGCTPPTPGPGGPMPGIGGSGFLSKFPKSRSIDRFSDASPQIINQSKNPGAQPANPAQIDYVGVGWDSSLRLQAIPYIKAEKNIGGGVREEALCANPTDPTCQPNNGWSTLYVSGGIGNCATATNGACVESITMIKADKSEVVAKPIQKFPKEQKEFAGTINSSGAGFAPGLASWLWKIEGDGGGTENDYLAGGVVISTARPAGSSWGAPELIQFFFELTPVFRETSSLIKQPGIKTQKSPTSGAVEVMPENGESGCLANDTGVCLHRRAFPADARFKVVLQIPRNITGWLNGRLNAPVVTSNPINGAFDRITIEAGASENIFAGKWLKRSEIPALKFPSDQSGRPYEQIFSGKGGMMVEDPGRDGALDAYNVWAPYIGDYAFAINQTWTVSNALVSNPEERRCPSRGVVGVVATNASAYAATAPVYNKESGTLDYKVAAPHYGPYVDGKSEKVNSGTYGLSIASSQIKCLYGMEKLPSSASISITSSDGKESVSTVELKSSGDWVYLEAKNFTFSSPTLKIKLNQSAAQSSSAAAGSSGSSSSAMKSAAPAKAAPPKISITCIKGKVTKKVTGSAPKCPAGFKKR